MSVSLRHCECGRELEKWCRVCSECRVVNAQIIKDIYNCSKAGAIAQDKYNKSEKGKIARHRADKKWRDENKEYVKERRRMYYENHKS